MIQNKVQSQYTAVRIYREDRDALNAFKGRLHQSSYYRFNVTDAIAIRRLLEIAKETGNDEA